MKNLRLSELDFAKLSKNLEQLEKDHSTEELELVDSYGDIVGCSGNCSGGCTGRCGGCGGSSCKGGMSLF
jgi:hypothetical protein